MKKLAILFLCYFLLYMIGAGSIQYGLKRIKKNKTSSEKMMDIEEEDENKDEENRNEDNDGKEENELKEKETKLLAEWNEISWQTWLQISSDLHLIENHHHFPSGVNTILVPPPKC